MHVLVYVYMCVCACMHACTLNFVVHVTIGYSECLPLVPIVNNDVLV